MTSPSSPALPKASPRHWPTPPIAHHGCSAMPTRTRRGGMGLDSVLRIDPSPMPSTAWLASSGGSHQTARHGTTCSRPSRRRHRRPANQRPGETGTAFRARTTANKTGPRLVIATPNNQRPSVGVNQLAMRPTAPEQSGAPARHRSEHRISTQRHSPSKRNSVEQWGSPRHDRDVTSDTTAAHLHTTRDAARNSSLGRMWRLPTQCSGRQFSDWI